MFISRKFAYGLLAASAPVATAGPLALASGPAAASGAKALPVLTVHMTGSSITVGGQKVSGAVTVRSTVSGENRGTALLLRLNKGVSYARAAKVLQSSHDLNAVQLIGAFVFDSTTLKGQPTNVQTVLQPARYAALDVAGKGQPRIAKFTVSKSSSPATLPPAAATTKAIEFAFRGSSTLKNGTRVRAINEGWLVHMNDFLGAKSRTDAQKLAAGLKAGKPQKQLRPYLNGSFFELFGPVSHG